MMHLLLRLGPVPWLALLFAFMAYMQWDDCKKYGEIGLFAIAVFGCMLMVAMTIFFAWHTT